MDSFDNVPEPSPPRRIGVASTYDDTETTGKALAPMALASLIISVVGIPFMGIASIIALVLGVVALSQIADPTRQYTGKGLAITGIILGVAGMLIAPLAILLIVMSNVGPRGHVNSRLTSASSLQNIQRGMIIYAQSNNTRYPGLNPNGSIDNIEVTHRYAVLLDNQYIQPSTIISPLETDPNIHPATRQGTTGSATYTVTPDNYSYAMLSIDKPGGRRDEWSDTLNSKAIVLSDRNTNPGDPANPASIHAPNPGYWEGNVTWNDGRVTYETSANIPQTRYGSANPNISDALFIGPTDHDALMVRDGK